MLTGLIIDTQRELHDSLRTALLLAFGAAPDSAYDLASASELLGGKVYDYIVVDPLTESLSLTLNLLLTHQQQGHIKPFCAIIALCASSGSAVVSACADLNPDGFFLKPARIPTILARLSSAIEKKSPIKLPHMQYERRGHVEEAKTLFEQALKSATTFGQKVQTLKAMALFCAKHSQLAAAKQSAHKLRGIADTPDARILHATILLAEGDDEKAASLIERTLAENPMLLHGYDLLAEAKYAQGDGSRALAARVRANDISPLNAARSEKLSSEAYDLGNMPLAQATVEYQIEHIPSMQAGDRLAMLAHIQLARNDVSGSLETLARAQTTMGSPFAEMSPMLLIGRLNAAINQGRQDDAGLLLKELIKLEESVPGPKAFLTDAAFCAYRVGSIEQGDQWLGRALLRGTQSFAQFERIKETMKALSISDRLRAQEALSAKARAAQAARARQFKEAGLYMDLAQDLIEFAEHPDADIDTLLDALEAIALAGENGQLHQAGSVIIEGFEKRVRHLNPNFSQEIKLHQIIGRFKAA